MGAILQYLRWVCGLALFVQAAHAQAPAVEALRAQLQSNGHVRALLIAKGGDPVFEHYRADTTPATLLNVASVTKSVVSMLVGIAAGQGLLRADEPLAAFFPEYAQGDAKAVLSRVTLRHLLTMSSGIDRLGLGTDTDYPDFALRLYAPGLLQHAFGRRIVNEPGSSFYYSNIDSHLVAAALSRRLKKPLTEFAREALFKPLGIDSFEWVAGADGVPDGAAGLRLAAPAMLRLGQVMRDGGAWQGAQVVPKAFALEATSRLVASDLPPRGTAGLWGYGFLWWTASTPGDDRPAFYAAGYGGQFIYVVPSLGIVIVAVTEQASRQVAAATAALVRDFALPAAR